MLRRASVASVLAIVLTQGTPANATDQVYATADGAIGGYDPVAYFTEGRAVVGLAGIQHQWNGAHWRFATVANRNAFAADPDRYAPQYGGYCAYGTASGYKVSTSPDAFAIHDGKLYLNYNVAVQRTWNKDRSGYIATADGNWPGLRDQPYDSDEASTQR